MLVGLLIAAIVHVTACDDIKRYRIKATIESSEVFEAELSEYLPVDEAINFAIENPREDREKSIKLAKRPFEPESQPFRFRDFENDEDCFNLPSDSDYMSGIVCGQRVLFLRDYNDHYNKREINLYQLLGLDTTNSSILRVGGHLGENVTLYFTYTSEHNDSSRKVFEMYRTEYDKLVPGRQFSQGPECSHTLRQESKMGDDNALTCAYADMTSASADNITATSSDSPVLLCVELKGATTWVVNGSTLQKLDVSLRQQVTEGSIVDLTSINYDLRTDFNPNGMKVVIAGVWRSKDDHEVKLFVGGFTGGQSNFDLKLLNHNLTSIIQKDYLDKRFFYLKIAPRRSTIVTLMPSKNQNKVNVTDLKLYRVNTAQFLNSSVADRNIVRSEINIDIKPCMCGLPNQINEVTFLENDYLQVFSYKVRDPEPNKRCLVVRNKDDGAIYVRSFDYQNVRLIANEVELLNGGVVSKILPSFGVISVESPLKREATSSTILSVYRDFCPLVDKVDGEQLEIYVAFENSASLKTVKKTEINWPFRMYGESSDMIVLNENYLVGSDIAIPQFQDWNRSLQYKFVGQEERYFVLGSETESLTINYSTLLRTEQGFVSQIDDNNYGYFRHCRPAETNQIFECKLAFKFPLSLEIGQKLLEFVQIKDQRRFIGFLGSVEEGDFQLQLPVVTKILSVSFHRDGRRAALIIYSLPFKMDTLKLTDVKTGPAFESSKTSERNLYGYFMGSYSTTKKGTKPGLFVFKVNLDKNLGLLKQRSIYKDYFSKSRTFRFEPKDVIVDSNGMYAYVSSSCYDERHKIFYNDLFTFAINGLNLRMVSKTKVHSSLQSRFCVFDEALVLITKNGPEVYPRRGLNLGMRFMLPLAAPNREYARILSYKCLVKENLLVLLNGSGDKKQMLVYKMNKYRRLHSRFFKTLKFNSTNSHVDFHVENRHFIVLHENANGKILQRTYNLDSMRLEVNLHDVKKNVKQIPFKLHFPSQNGNSIVGFDIQPINGNNLATPLIDQHLSKAKLPSNGKITGLHSLFSLSGTLQTVQFIRNSTGTYLNGSCDLIDRRVRVVGNLSTIDPPGIEVESINKLDYFRISKGGKFLYGIKNVEGSTYFVETEAMPGPNSTIRIFSTPQSCNQLYPFSTERYDNILVSNCKTIHGRAITLFQLRNDTNEKTMVEVFSEEVVRGEIGNFRVIHGQFQRSHKKMLQIHYPGQNLVTFSKWSVFSVDGKYESSLKTYYKVRDGKFGVTSLHQLARDARSVLRVHLHEERRERAQRHQYDFLLQRRLWREASHREQLPASHCACAA